MSSGKTFDLACPIPLAEYPRVLMAHGGGGRLMHKLIETLIAPGFSNPILDQLHDGAVMNAPSKRIAFTTDSHVVRPLFFPGGDIGTLAVNGTVNDLAMCGARPLWLSTGFIVEEGFEMETLWRVVRSIRGAADAAGVTIVTGDTKVVERGHGDGIYINTAGVGAVEAPGAIGPREVKPGDVMLISGDLGRHGMAVMSRREGLSFESGILSDCAPVHEPVLDLLQAGVPVRCLRDLTRGGLASALTEIATSAGMTLRVEESAIPVREDVAGACGIFGLDPLFVANEGRFVVFVPPKHVERALEVLRGHEVSAGAVRIGEVGAAIESGLVTVRTGFGGERILDLPSGEQLPRIC